MIKISSMFRVRVRVKIRDRGSVWIRCRPLFSVMVRVKLEFGIKLY